MSLLWLSRYNGTQNRGTLLRAIYKYICDGITCYASKVYLDRESHELLSNTSTQRLSRFHNSTYESAIVVVGILRYVENEVNEGAALIELNLVLGRLV